MNTPDIKHCPICNLDLPISEFGICRARRDGRNLYCKSCIRQKVGASRKALKEHKATRKRLLELQPETLTNPFKLAPVDRVRVAIENGSRTQAEIQRETKLHKDEIGDALANLLLWTHEIKTGIVDGRRVYLLNTVEEKPEIDESRAWSWTQVLRKANAPTVQGERKVRRVA